ncbi:prepilin-type N-terminal cleavage/methylation domain-containing protein [Vibrio cidicii]|uniref:Tfp pilus assembly protein FimT/FimU n=1 Tax=Vibrio cidicii TaxID=1763883 RepID=UPI003753DFE3
MARVRGFTLIEMLVAMVLLSATVMIATSGYRQYISGSRTFVSKYKEDVKQHQVKALVRERLEHSLLYYSKKSSNFYSKEVFPYWYGDKNQIQAVTSSSLSMPENSALYRLFLKDDRVVYCEENIDKSIPIMHLQPTMNCFDEVIVAEKVSNMQISYFGWPNIMDMILAQNRDISLGVAQARRWMDKYYGLDTQLMPDWMKVTIVFISGESEVWFIDLQNQDTDNMGMAISGVEG